MRPKNPLAETKTSNGEPNGRGLVYVCKKKTGKDYAQSTNTDIYYYNLEQRQLRENLTAKHDGLRPQPRSGAPMASRLAWLSMRRDGYEADKQDIIVMDVSEYAAPLLTLHSTGMALQMACIVEQYRKYKIWFNAAYRGTSPAVYA